MRLLILNKMGYPEYVCYFVEETKAVKFLETTSDLFIVTR